MTRFIYLIILLLLTIGCSTSKKGLNLTQTVGNEPVIIFLSNKYKKIYKIQIPVQLELTNNSIRAINYLDINYKYGARNGVMEFLYKKDGSKLVEIENNKKKQLGPYQSENYILYSSHKLDSSKSTQKWFEGYIEKMMINNKDTLHLGTVEHFKKRHTEFFERIILKDSITIQILENKNLGERAAIPLIW